LYSTLITAPQLAELMDAGAVAVLDVRDDLLRPGWGREARREAHIPGAVQGS